MLGLLKGVEIVGDAFHLMSVAREKTGLDVLGLGGLGEIG